MLTSDFTTRSISYTETNSRSWMSENGRSYFTTSVGNFCIIHLKTRESDQCENNFEIFFMPVLAFFSPYTRWHIPSMPNLCYATPPKLDHTRSNLRSGLLRDSDGSDHLWMHSTVIIICACCVEDEIEGCARG